MAVAEFGRLVYTAASQVPQETHVHQRTLGSLSLALVWSVIAVGPASGAPTKQAASAPAAALRVVAPAQTAEPVELGSIDKDRPYKLKVGLEQAALWYVHLTDYLYSAMADGSKPQSHYLIQSKFRANGDERWHRPMALQAVVVNGQRVPLATAPWELRQIERDAQGVAVQADYALTLADEQGRHVLEIRRTFSVAPGSYELLCRQQVINRGAQALEVVWEQYGQSEAPAEASGYGIEPRGLWLGYFDLKQDPAASVIHVDDHTRIGQADLLAGKALPWPPRNLEPGQARLAWAATLNRYFAVVAHRPVTVPPDATVNAKLVPALQALFPSVTAVVLGAADAKTGHVLLMLRSATIKVEAGSSAHLDLSLFAGPRSPKLFEEPMYRALFFDDLIHYSLGGCCSVITFQWLARLLLGFMTLIHAATWDWALAIIFLVVAVRLVLHPLTRKSQIQMTKFGKQMASLKPQMDALKRQFEKDPRRLQVEQAKLMREKGVSPGALLGCLPMFLQMPIWIALYAMLYYAIELRHQAAFWGVFQKITAGAWPFLADLSSADQFWVFADHPVHINFPLLNLIDFSTLNILPLIWGVLMFLQQKYMAPPAANAQAAQQQKIMMWMMLFFPLMLYSAPSGLTLYILASTAAGMLDSHIVKKHIQRQEQAGTLFEKQPRKPGLLARMMQNYQEAQRQRQERDKALRGDDRPRYRDR